MSTVAGPHVVWDIKGALLMISPQFKVGDTCAGMEDFYTTRITPTDTRITSTDTSFVANMLFLEIFRLKYGSEVGFSLHRI